jgi:hypothetical protein
MTIKISNQKEVLKKLGMGLCVEGSLHPVFREDGKCEISFVPYNRKPRCCKPDDRLVCRLEHGWVKESAERIKVYESVPKNLGAVGVGHVLQREAKTATDALIDCELDGIMFSGI